MFRRILYQACEWLNSKVTNYAQRLVLRILASGPIPRHIAFVMDGNRRYARMNHKKISQGHFEGFLTLRKVLEICYRLDVKCVSVYAFSIENFKRSEDEVDSLMTLAHEKLVELAEHGGLLEEYGVRLNVIGRKEMLPDFVQASVAKVEAMTKNNRGATLNLCMPYTSRDEITSAVESSVRKAVESHKVEGNMTLITEADIESQLYTTLAGSPPLDILVRTSGVHRLSDFMMWQCSENTQVQFVNTYWPSFGFRDFVPIVLDYQRKVWIQP